MFIKRQAVDAKVQTANEFTNIQDIQGNVLYTTEGYVFAYIQLQPVNVDLLSPREQHTFIQTLTGELSTEQKPFQFFAISQVMDISSLLDSLHSVRESTTDLTRRQLLKEEITHITQLATSGQIIERQFFVILWERVTDEPILLQRAREMAQKFQSCGVQADVLDQPQIYHLMNLFAHPQSAHLEITQDEFSATIPVLYERMQNEN